MCAHHFCFYLQASLGLDQIKQKLLKVSAGNWVEWFTREEKLQCQSIKCIQYKLLRLSWYCAAILSLIRPRSRGGWKLVNSDARGIKFVLHDDVIMPTDTEAHSEM